MMSHKILHLIDSGGFYGAEVMLLNLIHQQLKHGDRPMILSAGNLELGHDIKPLETEAKARGFSVKCWRMKRGLNIKDGLNILKWAKSEGFQVLHSHGYKFNILLAACKLIGESAPTICTLHGYTSAPFFSKSWLYKNLDSICLNFHSHICLVSPSMLNAPIISKISPKKISVVENGIEPVSTFDKAYILEEGLREFLSSDHFRILWVGRLSPEKNILGMLRSFSDVIKKFPDVRLAVVGDGPQISKALKMVQEYHLENSVHFLGFRSDVSQIMNHCDLMAISSYSEGLPISLLEAMREGLPLAATPVGAIPQVLDFGRLGLLANSPETNEITQMLIRAVELRDHLPGMADLANSVFKDRYTASAMYFKYNEVYASLISGV